MFASSVTFYLIETKSTLRSLYDKDRVYKVRRRFNDFKRLYQALKEVDEYKGFSIPPLPEDATSIGSYVVHSSAFIEERRHKLESFLRLLAAHDTIRLDQLLCRFLTESAFEDEKLADPLLYSKFKSVVKNMPNVNGLSLDIDSVNTFLNF